MDYFGTLPLPPSFNLGLTLLCGQAFRWSAPDAGGWFTGAAGGAAWRLRQEGNHLRWECGSSSVRGLVPEIWLSSYLRLDDPLPAWEADFLPHSPLARALSRLRGLRLLRQEPFECAASFLFAQGLSVPVIRRALERLCARFGEPLPGAPSLRDFPAPSRLARLDSRELRPFANNYGARADRLVRLSRALEAGVVDLEYLRSASFEDARGALLSLDGFGPKIADCVLLFSLDHLCAFPVDRWVLRAMRSGFGVPRGPLRETPTPRQYDYLAGFARRRFGAACGLAGQILFLDLRLRRDAALVRSLSSFLPPGGEEKEVLEAASRPRKVTRRRSRRAA